MPALSFKRQFAGLVETGRKFHTIRNKRKRPIKEGDNLILYREQRSKVHSKKLGESPCTKVQPLELLLDHLGQLEVVLDGTSLSDFGANELAIADGFDGIEPFKNFFFPKEDGLPQALEMVLIQWEPLQRRSAPAGCHSENNNSGIDL